MNSLATKEKVALFSCLLIAFALLIAGAYKFLLAHISGLALLNILGVSLIFIGTGCTPKLFFTPIKQLFSSTHKQYTLINEKIQQSIVIIGLLLAMVAMLLGF
ncbi:hypothetical protein [Thalassotalea sediminis]|uniref:hypothetical protein n=1 Tax=Thalassotalea sediminis TaxID=1759089 RepID=UPI00257489DA|nr:hypothetical protein [Thalassotalea sediminis]